jgi:hypothetical protein
VTSDPLPEVAARTVQQITGRDVPDGLDSLEEEIEKLNELSADILRATRNRIAFLLAYRNHIRPVSRLPAELLAYIMHLATIRNCTAGRAENSWIYTALRDWLPSVQDVSEVISLSQVCRSWRQTALGTRSLWTCPRLEIVGGDYALRLTLLERASGVPLTMVFDGFPPSDLHAWTGKWVTESLRPLYDAWVESTNSQGFSSQIQHLWLPLHLPLEDWNAPMLESLYTRAAVGGEPVELPRHAPRLHTLVLDSVTFSSGKRLAIEDAPFLPHLTRLALGFESGVQTITDIVRLLDVIQHAPMLTDLAVRIFYRRDEWDRWSRGRTPLHSQVVLPQLSHLTLNGDLIILSGILHHLQLPDGIKLSLDPKVDTQDPDAPELDAQRGFVRNFLAHPAHKPTKLSFTGSPDQTQEPRYLARVEAFRANGQRVLTLPICVRMSQRFYHLWLRGLADSISWDPITELHLCLGNPPDWLLRMALQAPRLVVLAIDGRALAGISMLLPKETLGSTNFLPALSTLVVKEAYVESLQPLLRACEERGIESALETLVLENFEIEAMEVEVVIRSWLLRPPRVRIVHTERRSEMPGEAQS